MMDPTNTKHLDTIYQGLKILWPYLILASGGLALAFAWLKKSGLITFGKPVERRQCITRICDEHKALEKDIGHIKEDVTVIKQNQGGIARDLNQLIGKVSTLYHKIDNME